MHATLGVSIFFYSSFSSSFHLHGSKHSPHQIENTRLWLGHKKTTNIEVRLFLWAVSSFFSFFSHSCFLDVHPLLLGHIDFISLGQQMNTLHFVAITSRTLFFVYQRLDLDLHPLSFKRIHLFARSFVRLKLGQAVRQRRELLISTQATACRFAGTESGSRHCKELYRGESWKHS